MGRWEWKQKLQNMWLSLTIKKKIWFFTGGVLFIILLLIGFDLWVVHFSVNDFQVNLEDNARNSQCMEAIEAESSYFAAYIKNPSEEKQKELEQAYKETNYAISRLPYDYMVIGSYRYAKTWSIRNSYEIYAQKRDSVLEMGEENPSYIQELYKVYNMQTYLQDYVRTLMAYTLEEGTASYMKKVNYIRSIPLVALILGGILFWIGTRLAHLMNKTIIVPIMNLVEVSRKIAANDFSGEEIKVDNQDEMGQLVKAFNQMKDKTGQYIRVLEETKEMADLLHKGELERLEVERRLEATNLELLKNQINPHFLFNTLNVIGGMANLEEAMITEKMIKALSSLFRYNLKMQGAEVVLAQELQVAKDYMYLQQMRFGTRISYHIECKVNVETVKVPTFSFQPLIENAIIHGLSKKEEGGSVYIRVWEEARYIIISVADTGVGMSFEQLEKLRNAFKHGATERVGIGLGNIYKRIHAMYPDGKVEVFSKKNIGTVIRLQIPRIECEE